MERLEFSWQNLIEDITEKVLYLESITEEISRDIAIQRAIREEWLNWNEDWKSAWLLSENEAQRLSTSIELRHYTQKNSFPNI